MATVTREQELLSVIYKLTDALEQANGRLWKCGGESVTPEMTESERAALACPGSGSGSRPPCDIRAAIQGWALYCFKRHGNDAHLYNGLAALGGVDVDGKGWQAQAPPASDQPGPTVINEDDGDVTIDFDYANDRVVSIRLGEESSGLSAFVDGESHALCPLDRVPPKVLALLRTEAKAVTLRQSDPPGLVQLVVALIEAANRRKAAHGVARVSAEYDEAKAYEALLACDLSAPASPAPDWQPIETAPTDGTPILVADATSVEEGVWQPETEDETECGGSVFVPGFDAGWWGSEWQPGAKQPTHWMRMPKPPSSPAPMPPVEVGDVVLLESGGVEHVRTKHAEDYWTGADAEGFPDVAERRKARILAIYRDPLWRRPASPQAKED